MRVTAALRETRWSPAMVTEADAQYALDLVSRICREVGPGVPGSHQERQRAEIIRRELESVLGAANVVVEQFAFAPTACLSAFPLSAALMLLAALLNAALGHVSSVSPWITALGGAAFSALAIVVLLLEFVFGFEFIDPFFKKAQSVNVVGSLRRPGTTKVRRLLIVSGHHDSAPENTWLRYTGYGIVPLSVLAVAGLLTVVIMSTLQLIGVLTANTALTRVGTFGWKLIVFPIVPAAIFGLFFTHGTKNGGIVPGAVDNLSASAVAVEEEPLMVRDVETWAQGGSGCNARAVAPPAEVAAPPVNPAKSKATQRRSLRA